MLWEYETDKLVPLGTTEFRAFLNERGDKGWELIAVIDRDGSKTIVWKRQKAVEVTTSLPKPGDPFPHRKGGKQPPPVSPPEQLG